MECRARHLGYVLAADGKIDLYSAFNLAARLLHEPEQSARDAPFHFLGRHLDHAGVGFLEPLPDRL
jgi:hypothetical protein